jgi:hypothetical protein
MINWDPAIEECVLASMAASAAWITAGASFPTTCGFAIAVEADAIDRLGDPVAAVRTKVPPGFVVAMLGKLRVIGVDAEVEKSESVGSQSSGKRHSKAPGVRKKNGHY